MHARRSFLTRAYPTMKKNNPDTPIMLRDAAGTQPRVYARYAYGQEKSESLLGESASGVPAGLPDRTNGGQCAGLSDKQIEDTVTGLVKNGA